MRPYSHRDALFEDFYESLVRAFRLDYVSSKPWLVNFLLILKPEESEMGTMKSNTTSIPEGSNRSWQVFIDGQIVTNQINLIEIDHPRYGTLTFGLTAGGYDGWSFHELGGGGSVILPFVFLKGTLFVGLIWENRPNQNAHDNSLNAPAGFLNVGESHFKAAKREAIQEIGYKAINDRIFLLKGDGGNPNNAFFETWDVAEGIKWFGVELSEHELDLSGEHPTINPMALEAITSAAKKVMPVKFYPYRDAAKVGCMKTLSGLARLIGFLQTAGRIPTF